MIQNKIAMIYDFDLTLSPDYMQKPIFEDPIFKNKIKESDFWKAKDVVKKEEESKKKDKRIDSECAYLHNFVQMSQKGGPLEGLTVDILEEFGQKLEYFDGIPDFFTNIKQEIETVPKYAKNNIKIEHYIVSSGMADILRGSSIADHVDDMYGCEFFTDENGNLTGIAKAITFTQKTEAIFNINKGVGNFKGIDVNASLKPENRRIPLENMIYLGDGPSDVPCMSLLKQNGGSTVAVYNPNPTMEKYKANPAINAFPLNQAGRADHCCGADYTQGSDLYVILQNILYKISDKITNRIETKINEDLIKSPTH